MIFSFTIFKVTLSLYSFTRGKCIYVSLLWPEKNVRCKCHHHFHFINSLSLSFCRFDVQDETVFTDLLLHFLGHWTRRTSSRDFRPMQKYHWRMFMPSKDSTPLPALQRLTIWFTSDFGQFRSLWHQTLGFIPEKIDQSEEECFEYHQIVCFGHFFQPIDHNWNRCTGYTKAQFNGFKFAI